jgi:hypothetical protein
MPRPALYGRTMTTGASAFTAHTSAITQPMNVQPRKKLSRKIESVFRLLRAQGNQGWQEVEDESETEYGQENGCEFHPAPPDSSSLSPQYGVAAPPESPARRADAASGR